MTWTCFTTRLIKIRFQPDGQILLLQDDLKNPVFSSVREKPVCWRRTAESVEDVDEASKSSVGDVRRSHEALSSTIDVGVDVADPTNRRDDRHRDAVVAIAADGESGFRRRVVASLNKGRNVQRRRRQRRHQNR